MKTKELNPQCGAKAKEYEWAHTFHLKKKTIYVKGHSTLTFWLIIGSIHQNSQIFVYKHIEVRLKIKDKIYF